MNAILTSLISAQGSQAHALGIEMNVPSLLLKAVEALLLYVQMVTAALHAKRVQIISVQPIQQV
jgi:hypothetical protein